MTLKLDGVEKVLAALRDVQNEVVTKVDAELQASANTITTRAKRKAPSNFAQLRNSIGSEKESNLRYTIYATAYHAPYIEFGTAKKVSVPAELTEVAAAVKARPKRGNFESFIEAIYVWGTKKKVIKKGDKRHAFNIARKIYLNGIAPQPFLWPSFLEVKPKLISRLQTLLKGINL